VTRKPAKQAKKKPLKKKAAKRASKPKAKPKAKAAAPPSAPASPIDAEIRHETEPEDSIESAAPLVADRVAARKRAFLAAFSVSGSVKTAAKAAQISRNRHYEWLKADAEYHARFRGGARQMANQALEDEATERAVVGVYEPNVFQGRFVYPQQEVEIEPAVKDRAGRIVTPARTEWRDVPGAAPLGVWKKSDHLLAFLLRGALPEKYRPGLHLDIPQRPSGPISLTEQNLARLSDDELAALKRIAEKLSAGVSNDGHDPRGTTPPGA
jgi:hypothetical protein